MASILTDNKQFQVVLLIAVILCSCIPACVPQNAGPQDITRMEGDTDVFIPCPFNGLETPYWKINNIFYSATQLQYPFVSLSNNQSGLTILLIHRSLNGTSFQCFVAPGVGSDPTPLQSTQGVLTVLYDPGQDAPSSGDGPESQIKLIHRILTASPDNLTVGWGVFDTVTYSNISPRTVSYSIDIATCDPQDVFANFTAINKSQIVITNSQALDDDAYINVALPASGVDIDRRFRIKSGVVTNNLFLNQTRTSCLDVPEPEKGTYMAVPISLTSDQSDIECQVVPTISKVGQCISLENRCGGRFTESIYTKFIQICNISSHLKICFSNVTEEIHNMPIHFFYSLSPWCTSTESRQPLRLYIASYKILFEEDVGSTLTTCQNAEHTVQFQFRDIQLVDSNSATVHFECSLASSTSRTYVNMTLEALHDLSSVLTQRMVNCFTGMTKFDDLQLQCGKTYLVSAALPEAQCILSTYNITFDQCSELPNETTDPVGTTSKTALIVSLAVVFGAILVLCLIILVVVLYCVCVKKCQLCYRGRKNNNIIDDKIVADKWHQTYKMVDQTCTSDSGDLDSSSVADNFDQEESTTIN